MATYKGAQSARPKHASQDCGNAWNDDNQVTPTAALTTSDEVIVLEVPAGIRLLGLKYRNGDFDTGTTLAFNMGYRSLHPDQNVAANATYFLSASTALQAAQAGWVDLPFDPITFQEPVAIVIKPTANATGVTGTPSVYVVGEGRVVGVT